MKNKNEFSTHSLDVLLELTEKSLKKSNDIPKQKFIKVTENKINFFHQDQATAAKHVSSILSGLYRQQTESEWNWLRINRPEWWMKMAELGNKLDRCFLAGDLEAGTEVFYQLVEHLKAAPIDELTSRIARRLDKLLP